MDKRIQELDSLRAMACLVIMTSHSLSILPEMYNPEALSAIKRTPLAVFRAGREAVLFFFILSGFVMALPFLKGRPTFKEFYLQRFFRLWVPYVISLAVAITMAVLVYNRIIPGLSNWANMERTLPDPGLLLQHLLLLGSFPNGMYNPVLWTLVQIMRISILFPFIMALVIRFHWKHILTACVCLSTAGFVLDSLSDLRGFPNDYDMTLHYVAVFTFGAVLAKHRADLLNAFRKLARRTKFCAALVAFLLYTHAYWFYPDVTWIHYSVPRDWIVAVAIAAGMFLSIGSARLSRWLVKRPVLFLGRISFSVYLYHAIVLLSCVHLLYGKVPLWLVWLCAWSGAFLVATIAHFAVERPANKFGRRLIQQTTTGPLKPQPIQTKLL